MALELVYVESGYWSDNYAQTGLTVLWPTSVIFVPRESLTLIQSNPTEIRQLNLDEFRLELKNLEDSSQGMAWTKTHNHNTSVTVGGVTLARVVEVIEPYTITFEDGAYAVNLVGANSNVGDRVNVNQVSVRSSNSAGLQDLSTLLASAYSGEVVVDPQNGQPGTSVPIGTRNTPSNNMTDAVTIAQNLGVRRIRFMRDMTLSSVDFSDGFSFTSDNAVNVLVTLLPGANVTNCQFDNLTVTGTLDGNNTLRECSIVSLTHTNGFIFQCAISGAVAIAPGTKSLVMDSFSNILSGSTASFDLNGNGNLELSNFNGEITLLNYTGSTEALEIYMGAGKVTLDATLTGGTIDIYGNAEVVDNSNGATVKDKTTTTKISCVHQRLDLDATIPNTYANDGSSITNSDFTLTKTDNGNGTSTVQRS